MERFNHYTLDDDHHDQQQERTNCHDPSTSSSSSSLVYSNPTRLLEYEMEPSTVVPDTTSLSLPNEQFMKEEATTSSSATIPTRLTPGDDAARTSSSTPSPSNGDNTGPHLSLGHEQPLNIPNYEMGDNQNEEKEDYNYDDEEIQKDAANEIVAMVVHIAIGFFMILFFGALIVSIFIVSKYGFFTLLIILILMTMALAIGYFVSKIMDRDEVLRPVRRKIKRWHAVATAVVIKEIQDFHLDLNEHLLLTNGTAFPEDEVDYPIYERMEEEGGWNGGPSGGRKSRRGGHRSKVFGFLVKPFLKQKDGKRFRFKRKKKSEEGTDGVPPNSGDVEMT
jgi:hypothetical protein